MNDMVEGPGYRLYCGDSLEILPTLAANAVITDPPYGLNIGRISGTQRSKCCHALDAYAVIGDDRPFDPLPYLDFPQVILWGANHYADKLPVSRCWLVWDKRTGGTSDDQADCELAWTNLPGPARLFSHKWRGMIKDSERDQHRVHPTQKPVALMKWCIKWLRLPDGATILDPYMGSGSCGVAAVSLGYNFLGVEIDESYCAVAKARIEKAARNGQQLELEE